MVSIRALVILRSSTTGTRGVHLIIPCVLDLASQASVREFASWFPGNAYQQCGHDGVPERELTVEGFERQSATNFLGPFALTALLYPHVRSAKEPHRHPLELVDKVGED